MRRIAILLLLVLSACLAVVAQSASQLLPGSAQTKTADEVVRVESDLVDLNVSVFSSDPAHITDTLKQSDFIIRENETAEQVQFFATNLMPFDLVLLLDVSGSTAKKLKLLRQSAKRFVAATRPTDRVAVIFFAGDLNLVCAFSSDKHQIEKAIDKHAQPLAGTRFWDALRFALNLAQADAAVGRRRAVIAMTDGIDNALPGEKGDGSITTYQELLQAVQHSDAIVIPVFLDTSKEMVGNPRYNVQPDSYVIARAQLAQLARESGGSLHYAQDLADLDGVYGAVTRELGVVYSLAYKPTVAADGTWRRIKVELPARPDLIVRTRPGYYSKALPVTRTYAATP